MIKRGDMNPNPRQAFLKDIGQFMQTWREKYWKRKIILMADMNEYMEDKGALHDFCVKHNLTDSVALLNPDIEMDPAYMYGCKIIYYIFTTSTLAELAIRGGGASSVPSIYNKRS